MPSKTFLTVFAGYLSLAQSSELSFRNGQLNTSRRIGNTWREPPSWSSSLLSSSTELTIIPVPHRKSHPCSNIRLPLLERTMFRPDRSVLSSPLLSVHHIANAPRQPNPSSTNRSTSMRSEGCTTGRSPRHSCVSRSSSCSFNPRRRFCLSISWPRSSSGSPCLSVLVES